MDLLNNTTSKFKLFMAYIFVCHREIKIRITLWGLTSNEIKENLSPINNPGPFIIIVTFTIVKTFRGNKFFFKHIY